MSVHSEPNRVTPSLTVGAVALLSLFCAGTSAQISQTAEAETAVVLPSGSTMNVPAGWSYTMRPDGLTLQGPEGALVIDLVEIEESADPEAAISEAWSRRRPSFDRVKEASGDMPGQDGWDAFAWLTYETSPAENRTIGATVLLKDSLSLVVLRDAPLADAERRGSEVAVALGSLRPTGHTEESYADRSPRDIDMDVLEETRAFIELVQEAADVPGLAVAVFDKDSVLPAEGFGVLERGRPERVTPQSLFLIASNTKALTTLLTAKLVDEGKFDWDTPVTEIYPNFRLGDAETTERVLVRHLVCACTGLPRQDFEWLFTFESSSPRAVVTSLASMQPTTEFGALFQYSNPLAAAAGYITAHVAAPDAELGEAYDKAMEELIFDPLGMDSTTLSFDDAVASEHATPHGYDLSLQNVPIRSALNRSIIPVRPAGGVWSNVEDYAKYVQMELREGLLADGTRYIGKEALLERRSPHVRVGDEVWYGMGLILADDVKGLRVISHGGFMPGYTSDFFFVPALGLGGVTLTNSESGGAIANAIRRRLLELLFDDDTPEAEERFLAGIEATKDYLNTTRQDWQIPPAPGLLERLATRYRNDALGEMTVRTEDDQLTFEFNGWESRMGSKTNPDGTVSFVHPDPGTGFFEWVVSDSGEPIGQITLRDPQHTYVFEAAND